MSLRTWDVIDFVEARCGFDEIALLVVLSFVVSDQGIDRAGHVDALVDRVGRGLSARLY